MLLLLGNLFFYSTIISSSTYLLCSCSYNNNQQTIIMPRQKLQKSNSNDSCNLLLLPIHLKCANCVSSSHEKSNHQQEYDTCLHAERTLFDHDAREHQFLSSKEQQLLYINIHEYLVTKRHLKKPRTYLNLQRKYYNDIMKNHNQTKNSSFYPPHYQQIPATNLKDHQPSTPSSRKSSSDKQKSNANSNLLPFSKYIKPMQSSVMKILHSTAKKLKQNAKRHGHIYSAAKQT